MTLPSAASRPHRLHVAIERRLLIRGQHGPKVVQLVAKDRSHPLSCGRIRWTPGGERRHLLAVVRLDRVDLGLLRRRQRDVLEENLHAPARTAIRWRGLGAGQDRYYHEAGQRHSHDREVWSHRLLLSCWIRACEEPC